ncbi:MULTISPECIES: nicotinate-nucleotide adenylyltransferase [unclassified Candidatus Frackibacter]|uniref:nicotinate-nucleotide adenylyltransferase n=1 Tax=unclassified Candidatus Frackibacter TaxID=2648818 RepID=UPI0007947C82|nr:MULTISPECIES: nicotinate-nucleotide adenylyltransferase [unclassified Candidatus Frackibacter]KXS43804.1 MAG: nicotinate-nucleotide adenylyltransferase [Candidatus Frackibacter sp. T328-2]SDC39803.1 nicotinate-nucleotide adenylyltransferase [Candidatus Frackibacter sp. WG11]SEM60900.1 nicotinate-nucleotide adenylyltransferase [Candidatus Frackibacter sp. WG12]SFL61015.1 nicotinate-nucleotide adenylyltransferase [Candidatus Frackibacter sp. WG13]
MLKSLVNKDIKRIGIMGGTFDPIHNGHLVTAEAAAYQYELDRVVFVPSASPPHKNNQNITDAEERYTMVILATMTNPKFIVSRIELEREGPSYAIDTVRAVNGLFEEIEIYFITGADAILEIFTWKEAETLLKECRFIAATRPGYSLSRIKTGLYEKYQDQISLLKIPGLGISSTDIRNRVRAKRPIKYQLPQTVEAYIKKRKLYLR